MTTLVHAPKNRKASSPTERPNSVERDRLGGKLAVTLQWLANNTVVRPSEQIELILVTWHPFILEDSYCDEDLAAQKVLDHAIRKYSPRSTMVCSGHRVWWLLNSGKQTLKLKHLKNRIKRGILNQMSPYPLYEKIDDSLIVQRIGCWNGPTTATAKGLAGIFADMAAGQTLLDNFGLPFERQHTLMVKPKKGAEVVNKAANARFQSQDSGSKSKKSPRAKRTGSSWITTPPITSLGLFQAFPSRQAPLMQLL